MKTIKLHDTELDLIKEALRFASNPYSKAAVEAWPGRILIGTGTPDEFEAWRQKKFQQWNARRLRTATKVWKARRA